MGRINGENSDYRYNDEAGGVVEVQPKPSPLELKIFICPYDQPSQLETETDYCSGTDSACPHHDNRSNNTGHALIHLSQNNGMRLATDNNNQITLSQNGLITLSPNNKMVVEGNIEIKQKSGAKIYLSIDTNTVTVESGSGAKIVLNSSGDIEMTPKAGRKVIVNGDLKVNGEIEPTDNIVYEQFIQRY